jgi:predicted amidohydrolase
MQSRVLALASIVVVLISAPADAGSTSRSNNPPRKAVIGTALVELSGPLEERLHVAAQMIDDAARAAAKQYPDAGLDLMVFPEFALASGTGATAAEQAVSLDGPVLDSLGAKAREHRTWIVMPMTLREPDRISNAAVLIDRVGNVAGIYRKNFPISDDHGVFEGGVTPGAGYPVFDTDFGRLGILICWDMSYDESWRALADAGAEIIAVPSASPQTLRPASEALRHHVLVVTSTLKDNASVFDPIGRVVAQVTEKPGVLVHRIDLSFAILHWSESLHEGRALTERYGDKVGYLYSSREDTGVFWSNDPGMSIGAMIKELGLREMQEQVQAMGDAVRRFHAESERRAGL